MSLKNKKRDQHTHREWQTDRQADRDKAAY